MTILLRDYQTAAVLAAEKTLASGGSPLLALATGTGKTTIFVDLARRHLERGGARVLVLVHLQEIVHQIKARFESQAGIPAGVEMGVQRETGEARVVVGSTQTVVRRPEIWSPDEFDLIVLDECHHSESASVREICGRFPRAKIVGVSATPERADKKGLSLFTEVPFKMGIQEGIECGALATPLVQTIRLAGWEASDLGTRGNVDGVRDWKGEALENAFLEKGIAVPVAHAIAERRQGRKTIAFLPGVKASMRLTEALLAIGVPSEHVDGTTPDRDRESILGRFRRGETQVLTNCAIFTEGVDIPDIACVAMVRPTFNKSAYVQCVGRGLRVTPTKPDCLVLDFTLSGEVDVGIDARKALLGAKGAGAMLRDENETNANPIELPPPDARFPWANPSDAAAFAFRFSTKQKLFFRGKFVDSDALISLLCSAKPSHLREERTFESWCRAVKFDFGGRSQFGLSEAQASLVRRLVPPLRDRQVWMRSPVTSRTVDAAINMQKARDKAGLCSIASSWTLFRFGFPPNLPKAMGNDLIDMIFESDGDGSASVPTARIDANVHRAMGAFNDSVLEATMALEALEPDPFDTWVKP